MVVSGLFWSRVCKPHYNLREIAPKNRKMGSKGNWEDSPRETEDPVKTVSLRSSKCARWFTKSDKITSIPPNVMAFLRYWHCTFFLEKQRREEVLRGVTSTGLPYWVILSQTIWATQTEGREWQVLESKRRWLRGNLSQLGHRNMRQDFKQEF